MPKPLAGALALALALPLAAAAQDAAAPMTPDEVKRLALEAIRENPAIVMEAIQALQAAEAEAQAAAAQAALTEQRDALVSDPGAPVMGNPEGDVTLVEFFDYNCPYCRRAAATVEALIEADPDLRVVYREFPILGEDSVAAARASLAANMQGGYAAFHSALMAAPGRVDDAAIDAAAAEAGLDLAKLREDMDAPEVDAHIEGSMRLAEALGIGGTPAFVVGANLVPGAVEEAELAALIAAEREAAPAD